MEAADELVALAVGMGFPEAQARRCVSALADTDEARGLFLREPDRLVNALLEFGQGSPPRGGARGDAAGGGGGAAGSADVIDLCGSEEEEEAPPPPAKRARAAEASAPVHAAPPARTEPPPPPRVQAEAAPGAPPAGCGSLLAQLAAERHARRGVPAAVEAGSPALEEVKLLTYNVWFMEDIALQERMRAIADIVAAERPHVLCFQEVTGNIERLLRASPFWSDFDASPTPAGAPYYTLLLLRRPLRAGPPPSRAPFQNSAQGRDLTRGGLDLGGGLRLIAATAHLESYLGEGATCSAQRVEQMRESLRVLDSELSPAPFGGVGNVLFAGDTNWDDDEDGDLARLLPAGWADAWKQLHPTQPGFTYDATANAMLMGRLRKRLDRVMCRLRDYEAAEIRMVGTKVLPGITYEKQFRNGGSKRMPVLPSDHFGLVFTMRRKRLPPA